MTFVTESQAMFIATLVLGCAVVGYLYHSGKNIIRQDRMFQMALARATEELNKQYSSEGAELVKRMASDLSAPEFKPGAAFKLANKLRAKDRYYDFQLSGSEQLEVLAWMLGWNENPPKWQADKVKQTRTMGELIAIAKGCVDSPRQVVISKLI